MHGIRADLYERMNGVPIHMPSLRQMIAEAPEEMHLLRRLGDHLPERRHVDGHAVHPLVQIGADSMHVGRGTNDISCMSYPVGADAVLRDDGGRLPAETRDQTHAESARKQM